jgi:hypothetical protein
MSIPIYKKVHGKKELIDVLCLDREEKKPKTIRLIIDDEEVEVHNKKGEKQEKQEEEPLELELKKMKTKAKTKKLNTFVGNAFSALYESEDEDEEIEEEIEAETETGQEETMILKTPARSYATMAKVPNAPSRVSKSKSFQMKKSNVQRELFPRRVPGAPPRNQPRQSRIVTGEGPVRQLFSSSASRTKIATGAWKKPLLEKMGSTNGGIEGWKKAPVKSPEETMYSRLKKMEEEKKKIQQELEELKAKKAKKEAIVLAKETQEGISMLSDMVSKYKDMDWADIMEEEGSMM